jgi:hypothetical protein
MDLKNDPHLIALLIEIENATMQRELELYYSVKVIA